jgi:hypothetical protein
MLVLIAGGPVERWILGKLKPAAEDDEETPGER